MEHELMCMFMASYTNTNLPAAHSSYRKSFPHKVVSFALHISKYLEVGSCI